VKMSLSRPEVKREKNFFLKIDICGLTTIKWEIDVLFTCLKPDAIKKKKEEQKI